MDFYREDIQENLFSVTKYSNTPCESRVYKNKVAHLEKMAVGFPLNILYILLTLY